MSLAVLPDVIGSHNGRDVFNLVHYVIRAFYEDESVIIMDKLLRQKHGERIKDEDIAKQLHLQTKQVRKYLNRLESHQLVHSEVVHVERQHQTLWFIDFKHFVNVVKLRLFKMNETVRDKLRQETHTQTYYCPNPACGKRFNALDAQMLMDRSTALFICDNIVCKHQLKCDDNRGRISEISTRTMRMQQQLQTLQQLLKKIENLILPSRPVSGFASESGDTRANRRSGTGARGSRSHEQQHGPLTYLGDSVDVVVNLKLNSVAEDEFVDVHIPEPVHAAPPPSAPSNETPILTEWQAAWLEHSQQQTEISNGTNQSGDRALDVRIPAGDDEFEDFI
eukprot:gnl/Spiro4/12918_TR6846_c0_g1_i1.p1 gnl/Spiro4/12918_TR6846_c0_g1~~gnl/Spiro4/12918_TR6846_c0_g1_i1.p1  ORF type:complete len:346 (-),score=41.44 gnl/Spiro4/12918_TR6846_c0_g1_i1:114-1121(-)